VDTLNQTFGHGSVYFGAAFGATDYAPMRISHTCIPAPQRRGNRRHPRRPPAANSTAKVNRTA
jgi:hypothetical protein